MDRTPESSGRRPEPEAPHPALDELLVRADTALRRPGGGGLVADALIDFGRHADVWEPAVRFRSGGYTRHLLHRTEAFEVLVLCWDKGLESDLHDHAGQRCWMTALAGDIEEVRFVRGGEGSIEVEGVRHLDPVRPAFIRDELGLHVVRARPESQAVSLHLYARPVDRCGVYCDQTGRILGRRDLSYDSTRPGALRG